MALHLLARAGQLTRHLDHRSSKAHPLEEPLRRLVPLGGREDDASRAG
jgi:hypothetical protein